jgi:hypothetical protein
MDRDRIEDTFHSLADKTRRLADRTQSACGEAVDQVGDATATMRRGVKQQPLVALLVAACVGYALGWLKLRR